ncbi:metalloregulator ArsR/SmtB family transcription factor [Sphingomonas sp. CARO-RG-8B-R24-01]|uniref:ArsR/SmtB family transcription factor n=1 Tax=Sphingomonas sp. CARO-RG-8B-R24-01 TaxID=2914831 RepID=UPI001F564F3A|nr:metalloregulator ArsR/SmtB family transcription factor [Sphingomonas sp. CARO-RG-8B-R24-01]
MESALAIAALGSLAQGTRLDTFRLLARNGPDGLPAGEVARQLNVPQNTMSAHLAILTRAGLVRFERSGRTIFYRADLDSVRGLMRFLAHDCCAGNAAMCSALVDDLVSNRR